MKLQRSILNSPFCLVFALVALAARVSLADGPIAIAEIERDAPVDFEREILPVFTKNCVACHNATYAESSLVLETPQTILKGGDSGPVVVPGQSGESRLLIVAAHQDEPIMPPEDNGVDAVAFSSEQLGLLKRWIDEGASGEVTGSGAIEWQSLPPGMNPIYAVALSADGQLAAAGRANQIFVYHVPSGQLITRLTDPALVESGLYQNRGVAHLDLVQSLAFSPDGRLLASGGFREVKLWRRPQDVRQAELAGASGAVRALASSSDRKWIAAGEAAGAIKLWDKGALAEPRTLEGHAAAVTDVRFLPDGEKLVSVSEDKTIRLWNVADGAAAAQAETPEAVTALAVLDDGARLGTGHADGVIRLWTLPADAEGAVAPDGEITGHSGAVVALGMLAGEQPQLVSAGADGSVRQWSLETREQIRALEHGAAVTALAVRPDGQQIASAGADNLIKLWNATDGQPWASPDKQPIAEMKGDVRAQFRAARLERELAGVTARVADNKQALADAEASIITASNNVTKTQTAKDEAAKTLKEKQDAAKTATDAKDAAEKELADLRQAAKEATDKAASAKEAAEKDAENAEWAKTHEDAKQAAEDAAGKVKEAEKKVEEATAAVNKASQEVTSAEAANTAAVQAAEAAVAAVKRAVIHVPQVEQTLQESETLLARVQAAADAARQAVAAAEKPFRSLAYSHDGAQLAAAGDNGLVRTWTSDSGAAIDTFAGHEGAALAAVFTSDGAILSAAADAGVILWNTLPTWTLERTIGNVDDPATFVDRVTALAFSPDGRWLASGGGEPSRSGELKIFDVADGTLAREIADAHSDTVFGLEFSPDGEHLAASAADRFVKVFQVADGKQVRSFEGHTHHVLGVSWKSDGKVLASCGADNVVKVWNFVTGDQIRTSRPFEKEVTALAFVGTTQNVVASSGDKTVRLVNTDNGNLERSYSGPGDFMYSLAASTDGRIAVSGGQESTLFVWLVEDGQLLKTFAAPPAEEKPAEAQTARN